MNTLKKNLCYVIGSIILLQSNMVVGEEAVQQTVSVIDYQSQIGRVLGVLLLLLAAIFIVVWLMKKVGYTGHISSNMLSVKACLSLSNKDKLYVIEVGDEQLLIGVNAGSITPLKSLEKPIAESKSFAMTDSDFSKKLKTILSPKITNTEINNG